ACSLAKASACTSPHFSRTHRSRPPRALQKDRFCQPEFFLRELPFLCCKIHCSGSSTILHRSLSCARVRFEGCAGGKAMVGRAGAGGSDPSGSRTHRSLMAVALPNWLRSSAERFDKLPLRL